MILGISPVGYKPINYTKLQNETNKNENSKYSNNQQTKNISFGTNSHMPSGVKKLISGDEVPLNIYEETMKAVNILLEKGSDGEMTLLDLWELCKNPNYKISWPTGNKKELEGLKLIYDVKEDGSAKVLKDIEKIILRLVNTTQYIPDPPKPAILGENLATLYEYINPVTGEELQRYGPRVLIEIDGNNIGRTIGQADLPSAPRGYSQI